MNGHEAPSRDQVQAALRKLAIATVAVYIVLALVITFVFLDGSRRRAQIERVAVNTTAALCTLRHDLEQRVANSVQFLTDHPNGVAGISAETIQQSITNQQSTIAALGDLDCSPAI